MSESKTEETPVPLANEGAPSTAAPQQPSAGEVAAPQQPSADEAAVAVRRLARQFVRRVVTLADIDDYKRAPKAHRFALLQQARYRAAKAGISSAPLWSYALSIVALLLAFLVAIFGRTPVDKTGEQILAFFDTVWWVPVIGAIVVILALVFIRWEAEWVSRAKTWQSAFEDSEKNLADNGDGGKFFDAWQPTPRRRRWPFRR